jgi:hypothetical protein
VRAWCGRGRYRHGWTPRWSGFAAICAVTIMQRCITRVSGAPRVLRVRVRHRFSTRSRTAPIAGSIHLGKCGQPGARTPGRLIVRHARARDEIPALAARTGVRRCTPTTLSGPSSATCRGARLAGAPGAARLGSGDLRARRVVTRAEPRRERAGPVAGCGCAAPPGGAALAASRRCRSTLPALKRSIRAHQSVAMRMPTGMSSARALFEISRAHVAHASAATTPREGPVPPVGMASARLGARTARRARRGASASTWLSS